MHLILLHITSLCKYDHRIAFVIFITELIMVIRVLFAFHSQTYLDNYPTGILGKFQFILRCWFLILKNV